MSIIFFCLLQMTGQRYKRTNFEDDDTFSNGPSTPPGIDFFPSVALKGGLSAWQKKTRLERVLIVFLVALIITVIVLAAMLSVRQVKVHTVTKIQTVQPGKTCFFYFTILYLLSGFLSI